MLSEKGWKARGVPATSRKGRPSILSDELKCKLDNSHVTTTSVSLYHVETTKPMMERMMMENPYLSLRNIYYGHLMNLHRL